MAIINLEPCPDFSIVQVRCIAIYPYFGDRVDLQPMAKEPPDQFREVREEVVGDLKKSGMQNLDHINGFEILTEIGGLTVDDDEDDYDVAAGRTAPHRLHTVKI